MTNPFIDPSQAGGYVPLSQPEAEQVYDSPNPFAPAPERVVKVIPAPATVEDVQIYDGIATIQDAHSHIQHYLSLIDEVVTRSPQDPDVQVAGAKVATDISKLASETKDVARTYLWNRYGAGTHATPDGVKFSLSKPASTRRVDYKTLEKDFPDAYEAVVKTTHPGADALGRLTIK